MSSYKLNQAGLDTDERNVRRILGKGTYPIPLSESSIQAQPPDITPPPPSLSLTLTASSELIYSGDSVTLTWSSTNAISVTAGGDTDPYGGSWSANNNALSGSQQLFPAVNDVNASYTYSLTATDGTNTVTQSVTVEVDVPITNSTQFNDLGQHQDIYNGDGYLVAGIYYSAQANMFYGLAILLSSISAGPSGYVIAGMSLAGNGNIDGDGNLGAWTYTDFNGIDWSTNGLPQGLYFDGNNFIIETVQGTTTNVYLVASGASATLQTTIPTNGSGACARMGYTSAIGLLLGSDLQNGSTNTPSAPKFFKTTDYTVYTALNSNLTTALGATSSHSLQGASLQYITSEDDTFIASGSWVDLGGQSHQWLATSTDPSSSWSIILNDNANDYQPTYWPDATLAPSAYSTSQYLGQVYGGKRLVSEASTADTMLIVQVNSEGSKTVLPFSGGVDIVSNASLAYPVATVPSQNIAFISVQYFSDSGNGTAVFRSTDGGITWSMFNPDVIQGQNGGNIFGAFNGTNLILMCDGQTIYRVYTAS